MNIVGIMPIRSEAWIIRCTIPAALQWMDSLVVLNHASVDETPQVLESLVEQYPGRLHVLRESESRIWREMLHRQRLLLYARGLRATHVCTIDADEVLSANLVPKIRQIIGKLPHGVVMQLFWAHLWRGLDKVRVDGKWSKQWASMAFVDQPKFHWRARDGYDHHHRHPFGVGPDDYHRPIAKSDGALLHLQHAVWPRLLAKQAWYKMMEIVRWPGREPVERVDRKYSATVDETGIQLQPIPPEWYQGYGGLWAKVDTRFKGCWQSDECRRLVNLYGRGKFQGLDLFGVV